MMLRIGMVLVVSALASVAQTSPRSVTTDTNRAKPTVEDSLRSAQRQFPPEVWSVRTVRADSVYVKPCVYPALETGSLVVRRCPPANKIALFPSVRLLPNPPSK